jgi:CheY-like chemotaxis protein
MTPLFDAGLKRVFNGETTLEELIKVAMQTGDEKVKALPCPECKREIGAGFRVCPYCGFALSAVCPACNREVQPGWVLCAFCGYSLGKPAGQAPMPGLAVVSPGPSPIFVAPGLPVAAAPLSAHGGLAAPTIHVAPGAAAPAAGFSLPAAMAAAALAAAGAQPPTQAGAGHAGGQTVPGQPGPTATAMPAAAVMATPAAGVAGAGGTASPAAPTLTAGPDGDLPRPKVLVVDDEPSILLTIRLALTEMGCDVVTAGDGKEALEKVRAHKPNLIISDVIMPEMDGFAFVKQVRQSVDTAFIPILMLTSRSSAEDRLRGFAQGTDDYMAKPFQYREVQARVQSLLRRTYGWPPSAPAAHPS